MNEVKMNNTYNSKYKAKKSYWRGVKVTIPLCIAVSTVGISFGVIAAQSGLQVWQAVAMSAIVFAGASQMMAVGMIAQGAAPISIVISTFLLNIRHLVMSSYMMNKLRNEKLPMRAFLSFAVCDESFALFSLDDEADKPFLFGIESALFVFWTISTALGGYVSGIMPPLVADSFGIAFYAAFISMLVPNMKKNIRITMLVIITALINWILGSVMAASTYLINYISGGIDYAFR